MNNPRLLLFAFLLVALAQLYVPAKMIFAREEILKEGKEFKFKTAPVDPLDPFRGKYITLSFEDNTFTDPGVIELETEQTVYVQLTTNKNGFAEIISVSEKPYSNDVDYLKATASIIEHYQNDSTKLLFSFPFDRFYMEEFKAGEAEQVYRESMRDSSQTTYALVSIKNGEAVLKDVIINDISIGEGLRTNTGQDTSDKIQLTP